MNTVFATFAKEFDAFEVFTVADNTSVEVRFNRRSKHSACPWEGVLLILDASFLQADALSIEILTFNPCILNQV